MAKKIVCSWVFGIAIVIAILGGFSIWFPFLGLIIAPLTILSAILQGVENQKTQEDITVKHAHAIDKIQSMEGDVQQKHTQAMQEIGQARVEAVSQHVEAMKEIDQAKLEAARQYDEAIQEITKAKNEARAENLLLKAEKFSRSLVEKEEIVNEAIALYPDFKQRELRQLGIEMAIVVIDEVDPVAVMDAMIANSGGAISGYRRLGRDEIESFSRTAIGYLQENVFEIPVPDVDGLLFLACMYGYQRQFTEMINVMNLAVGIDEKIREKFQQRKVLQILLRSCDLDQQKLEALRIGLDIPSITKKTFCMFLQNFDNTDFHGFIEWVDIRRLDVSGQCGVFLIKIAPPQLAEGKVSASAQSIRSGIVETIVPNTGPVTIEELYEKLYVQFVLFCHVK